MIIIRSAVVKAWMHEAGIADQRELAEKLGIHYTHLSAILNNRRTSLQAVGSPVCCPGVSAGGHPPLRAGVKDIL